MEKKTGWRKKIAALLSLVFAFSLPAACAGAQEADNACNWYEIFVRSYSDSNGDGIGDLAGVTAKLDYLEEMGYNGIWLMPIMPSPSYHKYDVTD